MSMVLPPQSSDRVEYLYAPIAEDLSEVERVLRTQLHSRFPFIDELTGRVRIYQGKRLRPALLLLVAKASGAVHPAHHVVGAVIEMIHAATLVHDDLLDDADTRRHVTTVHAEWGSEAAILLGDYLFSQAYYLAASLDTVDACRQIGLATNRTCEGELRQVGHRGDFDLSEAEYFELITGKTAELIACACRLGAKYADASPAIIESMTRFGRNLGIAFQIADDLLDVVGDQEKTGKSIGTDWIKRKMTLPLIRLRDTASEPQVLRLRETFADPSDRWRDLAHQLKSSDSLDYTIRRAQEFVAAAEVELATLPEGPCRDRLHQIAKFSATRSF